MVDVKTGREVATVLPFADDGVTGGGAEPGPFFPSAVMPLVWEEDGYFASVRTMGVRCVLLFSGFAWEVHGTANGIWILGTRRGGKDHTSWQYA